MFLNKTVVYLIMWHRWRIIPLLKGTLDFHVYDGVPWRWDHKYPSKHRYLFTPQLHGVTFRKIRVPTVKALQTCHLASVLVGLTPQFGVLGVLSCNYCICGWHIMIHLFGCYFCEGLLNGCLYFVLNTRRYGFLLRYYWFVLLILYYASNIQNFMFCWPCIPV